VAFLLSALPLLAFHHHTPEVDVFAFGDSAKAFASDVPAESPKGASMVRRFCCGVLVFFAFTVLLVPVVAQPDLPPSQAATANHVPQRRDSDPILDDRLGPADWLDILRRLPVGLWLSRGGWWPGR
jgi:hypothetical protein